MFSRATPVANAIERSEIYPFNYAVITFGWVKYTQLLYSFCGKLTIFFGEKYFTKIAQASYRKFWIFVLLLQLLKECIYFTPKRWCLFCQWVQNIAIVTKHLSISGEFWGDVASFTLSFVQFAKFLWCAMEHLFELAIAIRNVCKTNVGGNIAKTVVRCE